MKKNIKTILTISLLAVSVGCAATAKEKTTDNIFWQGFTQGAQEQARVMLPIWEKAAKCTPVKSNDGSLQVYGRENKLCHIRYSHNDCYLPDSILKKYTKSAIKYINDTLPKLLESSNELDAYIKDFTANQEKILQFSYPEIAKNFSDDTCTAKEFVEKLNDIHSTLGMQRFPDDYVDKVHNKLLMDSDIINNRIRKI